MGPLPVVWGRRDGEKSALGRRHYGNVGRERGNARIAQLPGR